MAIETLDLLHASHLSEHIFHHLEGMALKIKGAIVKQRGEIAKIVFFEISPCEGAEMEQPILNGTIVTIWKQYALRCRREVSERWRTMRKIATSWVSSEQ